VHDKREIYQSRRNNKINVSQKIANIDTNLIVGNSTLHIWKNYLIVNEIRPSSPKAIHFFNKTTFQYITSTGIRGKGPGEITRFGRISIDDENDLLWAADHGKKVMWKFNLDSIFKCQDYKPHEKIKLHQDMFIERYDFLNGATAIGKAVRPINNNTFDMPMVKLNLKDNITYKFGYENPYAQGKKSNSGFALSKKMNIYVNAYCYCDLLTICNLEGELSVNIYGPDWKKNKDNKKAYFSEVSFCKKYIIASYIGEKAFIFDKYKRPRGNLPSKFIIFKKNGDYIKTIETGHKFTHFCVDEENSRVICYFEDEPPLRYFNLNPDIL
jgi:hypothetical protein